MNRKWTVWRGVLICLLFVLLQVACKSAPPPPAPSPKSGGVVVRDDSEGLLLTWVDEKGEAHNEVRAADVPIVGRDSVRVVDPNHEDPPEFVYLADLRQPRPDGTYAVHVASRTEFDVLIESRRRKNGPTLTTAASAAPKPARVGSPGPAGQAAEPELPTIIIYGAEWCGACHEAARYLKKRGIPFIEKDIEKDPNAAREMQAKLERTRQRGGSIPVIDVGGIVLVGFSPSAIEDAIHGR